MNIIDRIKGFLSPAAPRAQRGVALHDRFMGIREEDIPDAHDRALYETVLNRAMRGEEVLATRNDDGTVTIEGETYESAEAAREATKERLNG